MDEKKKPGLALMIGIGKGHPKDDSSDDVSEDDYDDGDMDAILDEVTEAAKKGDWDAFKENLKALMQCK